MAKHQAAKKQSKSRFWQVVFIAALVVFVCAAAYLGLMAFSYWQGRSTYSTIVDDAGASDLGQQTQAGDLASMTVDWAALRAQNPDIVAWVCVPGTNINYPVVQGTDNDYYLNHDFEGNQGWLANCGTVFMDYRNTSDFSDASTFIYGHHLNDGSMFSALASFTDQDAFDASRTVYLLTPTQNYQLTSYALVHCDQSEAIVQTSFGDDAQRAAYIQDKISRSVVHASGIPDALAMPQSVAFATCDNDVSTPGRYVLFCYIQQQCAPANGA